MLTSIIGFLLAAAKAVPELAKFCRWAVELLEKAEAKRNEVDALERKASKDAFVDECIAAELRVQSSAIRQQQATDSATGLPPGSDGGTGMDKGSTPHD